MAVEGDIQTLLAPLVGGSCYPVVAAQGATTPYITYQVISGVPEINLDGYAGLTRKRIQIDIWATSYKQAKTLEESVKTALAASTITAIHRISQDAYEPDTKLYRQIVEFGIWTT